VKTFVEGAGFERSMRARSNGFRRRGVRPLHLHVDSAQKTLTLPFAVIAEVAGVRYMQLMEDTRATRDTLP
jgi:hypothetical protein